MNAIGLVELLDAMRPLSMRLLGHEQFGQHARDIVLLAALSGGSMTPHKASEVCGIPRGTVARWLARLEARGLIQRGERGLYTLAPKAVRRLSEYATTAWLRSFAWWACLVAWRGIGAGAGWWCEDHRGAVAVHR